MRAKSKKRKLTLTIRTDIIEKVKQDAKKKGVSVSHIFERVIQDVLEEEKKKQEKKKRIEGFLEHYNQRESVKALSQSDKELWHQHLDEKYG